MFILFSIGCNFDGMTSLATESTMVCSPLVTPDTFIFLFYWWGTEKKSVSGFTLYKQNEQEKGYARCTKVIPVHGAR